MHFYVTTHEHFIGHPFLILFMKYVLESDHHGSAGGNANKD